MEIRSKRELSWLCHSCICGLVLCVLAITVIVPKVVAQDPAPGTCAFKTPYYCSGSPNVYSTTGGQQGSNAYIDANAVVNGQTATDFCSILNSALLQLSTNTYSNFVGVVDARGVNPANLTQTCTTNPWSNVSQPSVVLLPAGTIKVKATWLLPAGTKLIGEGGEDPGSGDSGKSRTIIQAQSSAPSPMIQMGTSSGAACAGGLAVLIQDLVLDAGGQAIDGIDNQYCQDLSSVKHVTIFQSTATALSVFSGTANSAANSGPYSDITVDLGTATPTGSTMCVSLAVPTRGIQKMTCTTGKVNPTVANTVGISLSAVGNVLEDVRIEGFETGVSLGSGSSGSVLLNIDGDTNPSTSVPTINVVQIASGVTNVALIGITNQCGSNCNASGFHAYTVNDLATNTPLSFSTDQYMSMYVLGNELGTSGAYSRYTTSPTVASWFAGKSNTPGVTSCSAYGSLYSNTGGSGYGLWVCSGIKKQWVSVQ